MPITPPLRAHRELTIGTHHKSVPAGLWGRTIGSAVADSLRLGEFATPVLTIDSAVLESNLAAMGRWSAGRNLDLAPHGKTTMAPALWARLFEHGAIALTLATPWQVQVARSFGVEKIMLAPVAVKRLVEPDEVAELAAVLYGPASASLTGTSLTLDGGWTAH